MRSPNTVSDRAETTTGQHLSEFADRFKVDRARWNKKMSALSDPRPDQVESPGDGSKARQRNPETGCPLFAHAPGGTRSTSLRPQAIRIELQQKTHRQQCMPIRQKKKKKEISASHKAVPQTGQAPCRAWISIPKCQNHRSGQITSSVRRRGGEPLRQPLSTISCKRHTPTTIDRQFTGVKLRQCRI